MERWWPRGECTLRPRRLPRLPTRPIPVRPDDVEPVGLSPPDKIGAQCRRHLSLSLGVGRHPRRRPHIPPLRAGSLHSLSSFSGASFIMLSLTRPTASRPVHCHRQHPLAGPSTSFRPQPFSTSCARSDSHYKTLGISAGATKNQIKVCVFRASNCDNILIVCRLATTRYASTDLV